MIISLSDELKGWAEARVAEGRYGSVSKYICHLIRRDIEADEAFRRLQTAIDEGLASGVSDRTVEDIIVEGRRRRSKASD